MTKLHMPTAGGRQSLTCNRTNVYSSRSSRSSYSSTALKRSASSVSSVSVEDRPIRLFGTVAESIVDGPGVRYVIFVQGCPHHCPGCHNPGSHDPRGGSETTTAELWSAIRRDPLVTGVTFSGGEPFLWASELAELGRAAAEVGLDVMTYTGYTYEQLLEMAETDEGVRALLTVTNYLVDGRFEQDKRDLTLKYRGSSNQRILDVTCYPNSTNALTPHWVG